MRFFKIIFSFVLGGVFASTVFVMFAADSVYQFETNFKDSDLLDADVILCLAGGRGRISESAHLWEKARLLRARNKQPPPVLYLSGVGLPVKFSSLSETEMPSEILPNLKEEFVVLESVSQNTLENFQIFRSFQRQLDWKKGVLVTSDYHIKRAKYVADQVLGSDFILVTASSPAESFQVKKWRHSLNGIFVTWTEYFKWLFYRNAI